MTLSGPDGYSADISSRIQPDGDRMYLGSDVYTATTDVISGGRDGDVYLCNVTSSKSLTAITSLRGNIIFCQHRKAASSMICSCATSQWCFSSPGWSH